MSTGYIDNDAPTCYILWSACQEEQMAKKHRDGNKMGRHTTLIDAAIPVVDAARKMREVSKVSLGFIKTVSNGQKRLKIVEETGCLRLTVRGNTTVQEIHIYTQNPKKVSKVLEEAFK